MDAVEVRSICSLLTFENLSHYSKFEPHMIISYKMRQENKKNIFI